MHEEYGEKKVSRGAIHHSPCQCNVPLSYNPNKKKKQTPLGLALPDWKAEGVCYRGRTNHSPCDYVCKYTNLVCKFVLVAENRQMKQLNEVNMDL
jgi:hypothetical protein